MNPTSRQHVLKIFQAALAAADSKEAVRRNLALADGILCIGPHRVQLDSASQIVVVGAGKASARMAQAVEETLGDRIGRGFISVKDGHVVPTRKIEVREAGHPLPDVRSLANGRAILEAVQGLSAQDVVLCLISGGGSALMEALDEGLTLEDLRAVTQKLMLGGANIVELNTIRKHISLIKGGQLARWAQPARLYALILSDVIGDDLSSIASGPISPDPTTVADALDILRRYGANELSEARAVAQYLQRGSETPKAGDACFADVHPLVVGSNRLAVEAAAQEARARGYDTEILTTYMQGEARDVGKLLAAIAREQSERKAYRSARYCLLAGGETTVTVRGKGRGGRNHEIALAAVITLDGIKGVTLLSAATDGGDGSSDAAGAIADGDTARRARALGLRPQAMLDQNDSHNFFATLGDQVVTGPTLTNVNDIVVMLID